MFSHTAPEMPSQIFQTLWLLLHTLFRWVVAVQRQWQRALRQVAAHFDPPASVERDRELIAKCARDLTKLPQHLAVILNDGETAGSLAEADALGRLIRWAECTGIGHISFYDHRGKRDRVWYTLVGVVDRTDVSIYSHWFAGAIQQLRPALYDQVCAQQQQQCANGNGVAANGFSSNSNGKTTTNGHTYSNGDSKHHQPKKITVHLIDPLLNRTHLVAVSRKLCQSPTAAITVPLVNATVEQLLQPLPEPELAFYFDEFCCTYGLSPWQIRLTEFVRLERDTTEVQLGGYLRALYKYAKCEQRFGK